MDTVNADNQSANLSQKYDGNGNSTDFLQYDLNDRLSNVSLAGKNVLSTYRSDDLRASKQIVVSGTGPITYFLYDGTHLLCELNSTGVVTACYGYGGTGLAQRWIPGNYTAYTFDPMGNVVSRLRQSDAPAQPYDLSGYDAFGTRYLYTSVQQGQLVPPDPVGYGGQLGNVTDIEANLVLMTYRYYSPLYCRFLTRDPQGYNGGINLYAYCRNNPINRFDPTGLETQIKETETSITVTTHVQFDGDGATPSNASKIVKEILDDWNNNGSNFTFKGKPVIFDIDYSIGNKRKPGFDQITIHTGNVTDGGPASGVNSRDFPHPPFCLTILYF